MGSSLYSLGLADSAVTTLAKARGAGQLITQVMGMLVEATGLSYVTKLWD